MKLLILALLFSVNAFAETSVEGAIKTALASEFAQVRLQPVAIEISKTGTNQRAGQYHVFSEEPGWNLPWDTLLSTYVVNIKTTTAQNEPCDAVVGRSEGYIDFVRVSCYGIGVVSEVMLQRSQGTLPAELL